MTQHQPRSVSAQLRDLRTQLQAFIEAAEALDVPLLEASRAKAREDLATTPGLLASTGLSVELKALRTPVQAALKAATHAKEMIDARDRPTVA